MCITSFIVTYYEHYFQKQLMRYSRTIYIQGKYVFREYNYVVIVAYLYIKEVTENCSFPCHYYIKNHVTIFNQFLL